MTKFLQLFIIALVLLIGCTSEPQQSSTSDQEIYDSHGHLWEGEKSYKQYLAQLDSTGQHVTRFRAILVAEKGVPAETRKKNDELIALSQKYDEIVPICSVHPMDGDTAILELERIAGLGIKVIKLHPHTQNFDVTDERVVRLCKKAGELGVAVLMDNANIKPGDSENLFNLAVRCSNTNFIFAHLGGLNFRFWNVLPLARTAEGFLADNIYFDISATVVLIADSPLEEEFIWTIRNVGIDKVFLGSDYPQFTLKQAVEALEKLDLDPDEKRKIRFDNAKNFLNIR